MQYRLKKENLQQSNSEMNFDQLKNELKTKIKEESHRLNVDNAKKRAMNQHVEYEQFEQMVLGADLKALKANEILKLQELHKRNYNVEKIDKLMSIQVQKNTQAQKEKQKIDQLLDIESFDDLKKFMNIYKITSQKTIPLIQINKIYKQWLEKQNIEKVFGFDFDSEIFIDFIKKLFIDFKENEEVTLKIFQILIWIGQSSNFEILIKISLTDYQKRYFKRISKQFIKSTQSTELKKLINKFKEIYDIN